MEFLSQFAKSGLKTLVLAMRELSEAEYENWIKEYEAAAVEG